MTPEQECYQQAQEIVEQALRLAPAERRVYLDHACAGDVALRREAESLLVAEEQAVDFLKTPAPMKYADVLMQERRTSMLGSVTLRVTAGPVQGKEFFFDEHDIFVFGRDGDPRAQLPKDDKTASRHHFLLEVYPPAVRLRDLGSLNGTHINGVKCGGRAPHETPEESAQRQFPEVDLKDGDEICVGATVFAVQVDVPTFCYACDIEIPANFKPACQWADGAFICPKCRAQAEQSGTPPKKPEPLRCNQCGKDVSAELGRGQRGDYVCHACQTQLLSNPAIALGKQSALIGYDFDNQRDKIGEGGMGAVYRARRAQDGATVALKVLLARVAVNDYARQSFLREIEVTRRLRHPHLVELLDCGAAGNSFYFAMEYCLLGNVEALMQRSRKLRLAEAGPLILQALAGLAFMHEQGFVHRDLKPANLLLATPPGEAGTITVKVADFGLAKSFEKAGFSGLSITNKTLAGTPRFMAREQLVNYKYAKPVTDVWSMAATLYYLLTGKFARDFPDDPRLAINAVLTQPVVPIRQRDASIPAAVAEVIDRALSDKVKERYQTAAEFRAVLAKVL